MSLNIVLVEPEIPQNTGNIARTCAALGARLHLVEPLGFSIKDKYLKRAGLDYWELVDISIYNDFHDFMDKNKDGDFYFSTTKAHKTYDEVEIEADAFLVFGSETRGLSNDILNKFWDRCIRIPMIDDARSLNLSNAVAILAYDTFRQNSFKGLKKYGNHDKCRGEL